MTPRFEGGQRVKLFLGIFHPAKSLICEIVQLLPYDEGSFQYRVKSLEEKHHRRASESDLTLFAGNHQKDRQPSKLSAMATVKMTKRSEARNVLRSGLRRTKFLTP